RRFLLPGDRTLPRVGILGSTKSTAAGCTRCARRGGNDETQSPNACGDVGQRGQTLVAAVGRTGSFDCFSAASVSVLFMIEITLCRRITRMRYAVPIVVLASIGLPIPTPLSAGNWAQFRGPNAGGRPERDVPLPDQLGPATNVIWKVPLPK